MELRLYEIRFYKDHPRENPEQVERYLQELPSVVAVDLFIELGLLEQQGPDRSKKSKLRHQINQDVSLYLLSHKSRRIAYSVFEHNIDLLYGFDAKNRRMEDTGCHEALMRARKLYGL